MWRVNFKHRVSCLFPVHAYSERRAPALFSPQTALAVLAGVTACLLLPALPSRLFLYATLAVAVFLLCVAYRRSYSFIAVLGALLLGAGWAGVHAHHSLDAQLPLSLQGQTLTLQGTIIELPVHEVRSTRFLLHVDATDQQPEALRGKTVRLRWYDDDLAARQPLQAGTRWSLLVRLRAPRGLRNPGGADAEKHALAARLAAVGSVQKPQFARRLSPPEGIDAWREAMSGTIAAAVPAGSSRYIRALALGDTRFLQAQDWSRLRAAGLTHLIAISGFHVGLVAGFTALLSGVLGWGIPALNRRFPRPFVAGAGAIVGAFAYAVITGMSVPTLRTAVMIAVLVLARWLRRRQRMVDTLALGCIVLIILDPLSVLGAGFWLSFAGVAWLLWCLPEVGQRSVRGMLHGLLAAQWVASLGLLPLTVLLFGQASFAGLVANLLAVPWWSLVVIPLSLLGVLAESVNTGFGQGFWRLAAWCFDALWPFLTWVADSPLALFWLPEASWYALPLAMLSAIYLLLPRGLPGRWLACLLWLPLLYPMRELPAQGEAELHLIDVGQGLSVLLRTKTHALLYDMGPAIADGYDAGERAVVPALLALGVRHLDKAIISHADHDHAGGWPAVASVFPTDQVLHPEGSPLHLGQACQAGQRWQWDGVTFRVLHPSDGFPYMGNETSCVIRIETAHGSALLTGDIGHYVERKLLREAPMWVRNDVVVVGHHGSAGSSDTDFVAATQARLALLSSGADNRFQHPRAEVVQRWCDAGAEILDTARSGALRVWISADGLHVRERRRVHPRIWDAVRRRGQSAGLCYASE